MSEVKLSFSIETTCQPKQYHSLKMGLIIHEVNFVFEDQADLEQQIMDLQKKYQKVLNDAKTLAVKKGLYSATTETYYDDDFKTEVSIKVGDQKDEDNQSYKDTLDKSPNITKEHIGVEDDDDDMDDIEDIDLDF